jgi:hypothetical protein
MTFKPCKSKLDNGNINDLSNIQKDNTISNSNISNSINCSMNNIFNINKNKSVHKSNLDNSKISKNSHRKKSDKNRIKNYVVYINKNSINQNRSHLLNNNKAYDYSIDHINKTTHSLNYPQRKSSNINNHFNSRLQANTNSTHYDCEGCEESKKLVNKLRKDNMNLRHEITKYKNDYNSKVEECDTYLLIIQEKEKNIEKDREYILKQEKEIVRLTNILKLMTNTSTNLKTNYTETKNYKDYDEEDSKIINSNNLNKVKIENLIKGSNATSNTEKSKTISIGLSSNQYLNKNRINNDMKNIYQIRKEHFKNYISDEDETYRIKCD